LEAQVGRSFVPLQNWATKALYNVGGRIASLPEDQQQSIAYGNTIGGVALLGGGASIAHAGLTKGLGAAAFRFGRLGPIGLGLAGAGLAADSIFLGGRYRKGMLGLTNSPTASNMGASGFDAVRTTTAEYGRSLSEEALRSPAYSDVSKVEPAQASSGGGSSDKVQTALDWFGSYDVFGFGKLAAKGYEFFKSRNDELAEMKIGRR
jgi:hypothetical protein